MTFRKAQKKDLPRISEFRKAYFEHNPTIRSHEPEYYEWKCFKNPVAIGEMWLAEDNSMLVGTKSMAPKRMKILGKILDAAEIGDAYTRPDYQRQGIFTTLHKAARDRVLDSGISLIYGTPNQNALPGYEKKLDYAQVPIKLRALAKPLHPEQVLEAKLHFPLLVSILSPIIEIVSRTMLKVGVRGIGKSDVFVSRESSFPDDVDVLWEQVAENYDVILVRSKSYLEWRYVANPDTYSILIARNRDGATLGYMVTKIGFSENMPVGFLCDFLTIEEDPNIFKKLLVSAIEEFDQKTVSIIYTWAVKGSFYDSTLLKLGFLPRPPVPIVCYKNELGARVLSKAYKWHFTMGDTDNI